MMLHSAESLLKRIFIVVHLGFKNEVKIFKISFLGIHILSSKLGQKNTDLVIFADNFPFFLTTIIFMFSLKCLPSTVH